MNRIVIIYNNNIKKYTGTLFYLEEIGQYIYDNITKNVFVKNESKIEDRNILYTRYDFILPETNKIKENDIIITDYKFFIKNSLNLNIFYKIFITVNDGIKDFLSNYKNIVFLNKFKDNIFFLVEPNYYNTLEKFNIFNKIEYRRGFYFNHLLENNPLKNKWLLFKSDINSSYMYKKETLDKAIKYCEENNIEYIFDTDIDSVDLCRTCKGLIYIRNHDFMPRFPYEFWYYKKPVIFFDVSDGLKKRFDDLELYKPIIKDIEKYKINLEGLKFE